MGKIKKITIFDCHNFVNLMVRIIEKIIATQIKFTARKNNCNVIK